MHVKMRKALAHNIINRYKRSLRTHRALHRNRDDAHIVKDRMHQQRRKIRKSCDVSFRDQKAMPRKQRPVIEKHERVIVLKNARNVSRIALNHAKCALVLGSASNCSLPAVGHATSPSSSYSLVVPRSSLPNERKPSQGHEFSP